MRTVGQQAEVIEKRRHIAALILCNYDGRTNLGKSLVEYSSDASFSERIVLDTVVPATVKLKNTEVEHRTVNLLYPNKSITKVFMSIIEELKERGVV